MVTTDSPSPPPSLTAGFVRWHASTERGIAAIAVAGLIYSLTSWPKLDTLHGTAAWRTLVLLAAAAAMLYLAQTAWSFWSAAGRELSRSRGLFAVDLSLAIVVGWVLWRGVQSRALLANLDSMLSALLTVSSLAAAVGVCGCFLHPRRSFRYSDLLHLLLAAATIAALVLLELRDLP